jgi:cobalt-zinc-cadmium efflux system protein
MTAHHPGFGTGTPDRRLWASAGLNLGVTLIECAAGLWAGSLALLSDAAHNLADVGALGLAIIARRLGRRAPTPRHTYGLKRAEVVAALTNAVVLIAISILIGGEAVGRLAHPAPVNAPVMLMAASVALVANVASMLLLRKHRGDDINVRSAFLHLAQDALTSLAVVVAALFARTAAGTYVDPAAALLIGIVVVGSSVAIVRESLQTLLEAAPFGVDVKQLAAEVADRFDNVRLHHVHVWEVGLGQRALTAHMKVGAISLTEAEMAAMEVRRYLRAQWGITHATLEAETSSCGREQLLGEWTGMQ